MRLARSARGGSPVSRIVRKLSRPPTPHGALALPPRSNSVRSADWRLVKRRIAGRIDGRRPTASTKKRKSAMQCLATTAGVVRRGGCAYEVPLRLFVFLHRGANALLIFFLATCLPPERIISHLQRHRYIDMRRDVQEIFRATPHHKQVMMFSATLAKEIRVTCKKFMANVGVPVDPIFANH